MKSLNNLNEELQVEFVKQNPLWIEYINSPTEKVQLAAVKKSGYAIQHIKKPSEKVQKEAVRNFNHNYDNDIFVTLYIKSEKAKELHKKLKKHKSIMK